MSHEEPLCLDQPSSQETGPSALNVTGPIHSSERELPTGGQVKTTVSLVESTVSDWRKEAERQYNEGAKLWNKLPGHKLLFPKDKFRVSYCYHAKAIRVLNHNKVGGIDTCKECGYPVPGSYDFNGESKLSPLSTEI